ncbi:MAG TPA: penicillin acylase family protein [Ktedonobacterales bacterium]|nr:penicillin acylase family protein [Ktedonobacterales bacterium]
MRKLFSILGRILITLLAVLVALALVLGGGAVLFVGRTLPQTSGTLTLSGLQAPVSVIRDRWGVPHITGQTLNDVAFAQGYVTAQDRLFQMEFNRDVAAGRLAELFGPGDDNSLIDADEFLRTLDLEDAARDELAGLDPTTKGELQAYSDGVNAFLNAHHNSLPLEFTILGDTPRPWTPLDSLAYGRVVALSLDNQWYYKYTRAMLLAKIGPDLTSALFPPYPDANPTLFTAGGSAAPLNPTANIPPDVAVPHPLAAAAQAGPSAGIVRAFAGLSPDLLRGASVVHDLLGDISDSLGSNDWVVDGTRTTTGKPLLANDPHLGINMPSIWYEVALRGGGLDVIGFSFPGTPGVIIGHNDFIAWGVTNVGADDTDLYLETLDPANHPGMYLYHGVWRPLQTRTETIQVRGGAPVTFTVRSTQHGPLLNSAVSDLKGYPDVALKWTALQPIYTFVGFYELDKATDWQQFNTAVDDISISQNFVYADTAGNIGYRMSGMLPIRDPENDTLPVDGTDPTYEWRGYVPQAEMPRLFNPPTHIIATANNQIVPDDYPIYVTASWDQGYRARRIVDLLSATQLLSPNDFAAIQTDVYAIPTAQLVPAYIAAGNAAGGDAAAAAHALTGWNGRMDASSTAAAVYEVATGELMRSMLVPLLGQKLYELYRSNYSSSGLYSLLLEQIANPTPPFFSSPAARDKVTAGALAWAMGQLRGANGALPTWGQIHQAHFDHPLASVQPLNLVFGLNPVARSGGAVTINIGGDGGFSDLPPSYDQHSVPSMRQIIDLGNLDASLWVTTTGESGQPYSAHYSDLIPLWADGTYQQMAFTAQAVTHATASYLQLNP